MNKKVAIIGGGFGGLALGCRLQARGYHTSIYETHSSLGGRAQQFTAEGYTFDRGPTILTAPFLLEELFALGNLKMHDFVHLKNMDPLYRVIFHDNTTFDVSSNYEKMETQMAAINPKDAARYRTFLKETEAIYKAVIVDRLGAQPLHSIQKMLSLVPRIIKLHAWQTVTKTVNKYFDDYRHRFLFSFHTLFIGGNPFKSPAIYLSIAALERKHGIWYALGGMKSIIDSIEYLYKHLNGHVHTNNNVEKIVIKDGKAIGIETNTGFHPADIVVSNADILFTYKNLIDEKHRKHWKERRLNKLRFSMSCFILYIGLNKKYKDLYHHTLFVNKDYKDLLDKIFKTREIPEDISIYVHNPNYTDPSASETGGDSIYALIPVPNVDTKETWNTHSEPFKDHVINILERWGLTDLRKHIAYINTMTPNDFMDSLHATQGNAFGLQPTISQLGWFRPHNKSEDIKNLYFVGAGTHPGAGIPGVILSAHATENAIINTTQ